MIVHRVSVLLLASSFVTGVVASPLAADGSGSEKVTFYKDVLPVLQENCQECHRASGANYGGLLAPMPLVTYEDVRPWSKGIAQQIRSREMPPWDAAREHRGVFLNERSLSDGEIETVLRWVATGSPRGDLADAPEPRVFENNDGWMIGEPDLIIAMPEPYFVADEVGDLYAAFSVDLTDEQLPADSWITAFQCKPGSPIIHHFNAHLLAPIDGQLPPPAGFPGPGEIAPQGVGRYIGGTASGTDANAFPEGFGLPLKKGTRVTFDVHYHKEPGPGTGMWDRSHIGFKLSRKPPTRRIGGGTSGRGPLGVYRFAIPAGDPNYQLGPVSRLFSKESDLISLMPHMHLRGKAAKFEAFYPDGTSEVLLHVPSYDFSWQTVYRYKDLKRVPAGTRIEFTAWYDNSSEKAAIYNFDSTRSVAFGRESTDEMMMGFVTSSALEDEPSSR